MWKIIAHNPEFEQRMKQYYDEKGLSDIRICLASWIEEKMLVPQPIKSEHYEQTAQQFYDELKQKLIALGTDNSANNAKLHEICKYVAQTPALELYNFLYLGLQREAKLMEEMPQNPYMMNSPNYNGGTALVGGINNLDTIIVNNLYVVRSTLSVVAQNYQQFQEDYKTFHAFTLQSPQVATELRNTLISKSNACFGKAHQLVEHYGTAQDSVLEKLKSWQRCQALAGNGAPQAENLEQIQQFIETLLEIIREIRSILVNIAQCDVVQQPQLRDLQERMHLMHQVLICSSFIVDKQPPQVMKTNTKFSTGVRWLIGPQMNIYQNPPHIHCVILSEQQAQRHYQSRTLHDMSHAEPPSSGEISGNDCVMEYQSQTRIFSASFRALQLKRIKRAEKRGTESVMDEKFALLFYATIISDYKIRVWTLSLPVVVIVHGNQEPQSWATITWDNAFSEIMREPFNVPERVTWQQLSDTLNMKFQSTTSRGLTQENLNFLYEKLFSRTYQGNECMHATFEDYITWGNFCKEPLANRDFTFWDWFYAIMKLTKDHLHNLWTHGLIVGFINRESTEKDILPNCLPGTFLLRFSDSALGGITVAFVSEPGNVLMLTPWTAKDLQIRCLADRILDLKQLQFLFPDKPKTTVFTEFSSGRENNQKNQNGYVGTDIRATVPNKDEMSSYMLSQQMKSPMSDAMSKIGSPAPTCTGITSPIPMNITSFFYNNANNFFQPENFENADYLT